jgi:hypothetical protein
MPGQSSKSKKKQRAITPKLGKAELWFFCTALLLHKIYLHTKFHVNTPCRFKVMSQTKFKVKNKQREITPKSGKEELWFFCTVHLLNEIYLPTKFHVHIPSGFRVMSRRKFKVSNKQRAIIPKLGNTELWFFCTAHLHNEIYLPTMFHIHIPSSFRVMSRTKLKV